MGKSGNAGTAQAKAAATAKSSAKAAAGSGAKAAPKSGASKDASAANVKDKAAASSSQAAKDKGKDQKDVKEEKVDDGKAKLLEEAQQKFADDERDERTRLELRDQLREAKAGGRPARSGSLDKSIVRVDKFKNKLKLLKGDSDLAGVNSDIAGVDASKYVPELAECILEAAGVTLKLKELFAGVKVCVQLALAYEDFASCLAKALDKAYKASQPGDLNRRRFLVRFCVELCVTECITLTESPLVFMMKELCDVSVPDEQVVVNFTILVSFVQKHAVSCLGIVPARQKTYEEALGKPWVERKCSLSEPAQVQLSQLIVGAYQGSAGGLLQGANTRFLEQEKVNTKLRVDKGQVDAENDQKYQSLKENLQKVQGHISTLSEFLNQPMPSAQEEETAASRLAGRPEQKEQEAPKEEPVLMWEDAEQQRFYEDPTDLKDLVPAVLLNPSKGPATTDDNDKDEDKTKLQAKSTEDKTDKTPTAASDFDLYLMRVAKAETAKHVDDLAVEYFHEFNSARNRRALMSQFLSVHKSCLHLLAPYARFIAMASPFLKDLSNTVLTSLQQELKQLIQQKDPVDVDSKVKTVRYLCELCKFKVCPPGVILDAFTTFCDDFTQHNAELCANILQCCGRFLCYTPETSVRTENLLERMMRLKTVKSMPLRLEIMLEDAYYQVKPPEGKRRKAKDKDPIQLFTQHLIYELLYIEEDEDKVLKLVRKLPWSGQAPKWLKKAILELNMHANYESLYQLASLLSGLAKYRDTFVIDVIDALLEHIQLALERGDFREMPLRVRQVKLLGELYNYRLVDSNLIFDMMYHLIGFGGPTCFRAGQLVTAHRILERALTARKGALGSITEDGADDSSYQGQQLPAVMADPQHPLEPPWEFFRTKLVCVLLDTCGHYFDRGAVKQKLDRFLHFFIRYVHTKGELPLRVMYMVNDTLERIRPKMTFSTTKAEADEVILKMLSKERETLDLSDGLEDTAMDEEEEDDDDEDEEESEEETSSEDSESSEGEDDSEEEEEDDGESDEAEDMHDYSRGEEAAKKTTQEMDDFDKEVQQMLIEALEKEKNAPRALSQLPTAPPMSIARGTGEGAPSSEAGVFSFLQKKTGGKVITRQIEIPEDSKLIKASREQEKQESQEKEDLKRYIMSLDHVNDSVSSGQPPIMVAMRAGKGGSKGSYGPFNARSRNHEYVKDDFLPEDDRERLNAAFPRPRALPVGKGSGGRGGGSRGGGGNFGGKGRGGGGGGRGKGWSSSSLAPPGQGAWG